MGTRRSYIWAAQVYGFCSTDLQWCWWGICMCPEVRSPVQKKKKKNDSYFMLSLYCWRAVALPLCTLHKSYPTNMDRSISKLTGAPGKTRAPRGETGAFSAFAGAIRDKKRRRKARRSPGYGRHFKPVYGHLAACTHPPSPSTAATIFNLSQGVVLFGSFCS